MEELVKDMKPKFIEDLGMRFMAENSNRKYRYGLYECQYCSKEFEAQSNNIKHGLKSCGCQRNRIIKEQHSINISHSMAKHRFYKTWCGMIHRCNNPKNKDYIHYGGRGITVCEEWLDVTIFIAWAEATHPNIEGYSLDRIDNDLGYSPENCRWADKTTQNTNQRMKKSNTSGFVGVHWDIGNNKYVARITVLGNKVHIGSFLTKIEAVLARDNYIIENGLPHKLSILNTGL